MNTQSNPGFTPEQVQALTAHFQERFTKTIPPAIRTFVDPDFGGLRFSYLDEAKNHPSLLALAREHLTEFTNSRVKAGALAKLFIGKVPVKATRAELLKALELGDSLFQLNLLRDKNDFKINRGYAFLVVAPDVAKLVLNKKIQIGEDDLTIKEAN